MNGVKILGEVNNEFGKYYPNTKFRDLNKETRSKVRNYEGFDEFISGKENRYILLDFKLNEDTFYYCQMGGDWEDPCRFFLVNENKIYIPSDQDKFPFRPEVMNNVEKFLDENSVIISTARRILNEKNTSFQDSVEVDVDSFDYRLIENEDTTSIRRVYYNKDAEPVLCGENPVELHWEKLNQNKIKSEIDRINSALEKEKLNYKYFENLK